MKVLVLDKADGMLEMGFQQQLDAIVNMIKLIAHAVSFKEMRV